METDSHAGCTGVPMTPSRNSNRHELLWENFPNCTDAHWEEIGRTPNVGPRPRNYSKAVNLSDRRRTLSEGQDWFDDLSHTDFDDVFLRDKFVPLRDASSQVSGGRFKEARNSRSDVSEEEVSSKRESGNRRERKRSVGPRMLDSGDFSYSSDDVLHGPVFYIGSGKTPLISNSPDGLLPKSNRHQLTKDISRAAKQLKYFEQPPRRERGQRTGSLSAATKGSKTREHQNGYSAIDWPVYEGLGGQRTPLEVGGSKLAKEGFRISNKAPVAKIDQPAKSTLDLTKLPTPSDEDSPNPNDYGFASSRDTYENSTSKNSCSEESSKSKDMFAWNICFDPTPMKSDGARFATEERKESLPSTSRQCGASHSATLLQPVTSRKKWDKTSKNSNLGEYRDNEQPNLLDLDEINYSNVAGNMSLKKYSQRSLRSAYDQSYKKRNNAIADPFTKIHKPCDMKEIPQVKYSGCGKVRDPPVIVSKHSDSLRRDGASSRSGNYYYGKKSEQSSRLKEEFDSKERYRKREAKCKVHGKERFREDYDQHRANCEIHNEASESMESSWNEESCRHGGCVNQFCPFAAYLPILLSHGCNHGVLSDFACKRKIYKCCSEAKPRGCNIRRKPCSIHEKPRSVRVRVHSSEEPELHFDPAYDAVDRDVGVDSIDGKTYNVEEISQSRRVQKGNSPSFRKFAEPPVLLSYRRSVDTATDVLEAEQKIDMSSQTEPTTLNCSTQVKPAVRHSVTQYSGKVNNHNKDTQCITHTTAVCTQVVVFEPLDRGTQFPERKENHHKQTQCNLATGKKSVQTNLKYKPNPVNYNNGKKTSYRPKEDYFHEDCSFRSSQSSYLQPPDISTNLTIVAPKSALPSVVAALAAASSCADFLPQMDTKEDIYEQPALRCEVSPVTLRCSVMSVRPVDMFQNENVAKRVDERGEDCVGGGRQRAFSLRASSAENSSVSTCSRSRGKSVSFQSDIARFFDHPSSPQRPASSDDSDGSDNPKHRTHPLQCCGYLN